MHNLAHFFQTFAIGWCNVCVTGGSVCRTKQHLTYTVIYRDMFTPSIHNLHPQQYQAHNKNHKQWKISWDEICVFCRCIQNGNYGNFAPFAVPLQSLHLYRNRKNVIISVGGESQWEKKTNFSWIANPTKDMPLPFRSLTNWDIEDQLPHGKTLKSNTYLWLQHKTSRIKDLWTAFSGTGVSIMLSKHVCMYSHPEGTFRCTAHDSCVHCGFFSNIHWAMALPFSMEHRQSNNIPHQSLQSGAWIWNLFLRIYEDVRISEKRILKLFSI